MNTHHNDWQIEYAKACIKTLEATRKQIMLLANMTSKLRSDIKQNIGAYADRLKDYREVLEEFIPYDYDEGK